MTYNKVDFVAGSTVVFTGSLTVRYEGEFSTASLAVALAKLLLLPLHTVQLQRSRRLSTRRVQTLSERCDYSIQFLDSTGTLHKSVEATLKAKGTWMKTEHDRLARRDLVTVGDS